jgi:hypothetical protein
MVPAVRSIPKTPVAQLLWLVCILAVLVMIAGHAIAGLGLMSGALLVTSALRVLGLR